MGKIILVTGGARSGKSSYAEKMVSRYDNVAYIATSQILDDEMKYRVKLHRERRPLNWKTYECPYNAHETLEKVALTFDAVLFDCVTIYVSNIVCSLEEEVQDKVVQTVLEKISLLIDKAEAGNATVVFVTNEVGDGIVPDNKLARIYRDTAGLANQKIAAAADEVYLVVCGIAVDIKKLQTAFKEV